MQHRFADFTKIIGRGPTLSRPLTREEARISMGMVLDDEADPQALGGFLLVLRQRGETADELAGFVDAVRERCSIPLIPHRPDLDWPTYADAHRQQPWFILSALLLAGDGIRVLMHGIDGASVGCAPTRPALDALGIRCAKTLAEAATHLDRTCFAYIGLEDFSPATEKLFHLKPILGVRSVANTFARDINPLAAETTIVGIVHTPYRPLHQEALKQLGNRNAAVFKGVGGEAQRNPFKASLVATLRNGTLNEEEWSSISDGESFLWREEDLSPDRVAALWNGVIDQPAAVDSIIATTALILKTMGRADTQHEALILARHLWENRHKTENAARISA